MKRNFLFSLLRLASLSPVSTKEQKEAAGILEERITLDGCAGRLRMHDDARSNASRIKCAMLIAKAKVIGKWSFCPMYNFVNACRILETYKLRVFPRTDGVLRTVYKTMLFTIESTVWHSFCSFTKYHNPIRLYI